MKRNIYINILRSIFFLALSGEIGCSGENEWEPFEKYPIVFSAGTQAASESITRTNAIYSAEDLVGKKMLIYGNEYSEATTPSWVISETNKLFMPGIVGNVVYNAPEYNIDYTSSSQALLYYAPANTVRYDFRVVFPTDSASGVTPVPMTNNSTPKVKIELYKRPDLMVASVNGVSKSSESIPLHFEHLLTQVSFKIIKDTALEQNVYLNKMTISGRTRAKLDVVNKTFSDVDIVTGASVLLPGYPHPDFKIPSDVPKEIRDVFLFEVNDASSLQQAYSFELVLNEVSYYMRLPLEGMTWKPGYKYIYTIKVKGSDIYIEVDRPVVMEIWQDENHNITVN